MKSIMVLYLNSYADFGKCVIILAIILLCNIIDEMTQDINSHASIYWNSEVYVLLYKLIQNRTLS